MSTLTRSKALRLISNGLYVFTARDGETFGAATVSWVTQVSFKPPLIVVALRQGSSAHECLTRSDIGVLHIVSRDDQGIAQRFFRPAEQGNGLLNGEPWRPGPLGAPVLINLPSWIACRTTQRVECGGDHDLFVLEVLETGFAEQTLPLTVAESPWEYGG